MLNRTGRYRPLTILAPISSITCFLLLYLRWTTHPLATIESLYVAFWGFSNGVSTAAVFVFLSAATKKEDVAIASGGFYLATSLGEVVGLAVQNCVLQGTLRQVLPVSLREVEGGDEVRLFRIYVICILSIAPRLPRCLANDSLSRNP